MTALLNLWSLLDGRQRRRFAWLQGLSLVMAFTTLGGLAALIPFMLTLTDHQIITRQPQLAAVYRLFEFRSSGTFTLALGAAFVVAIVLANLINFFGAAAMSRFAYAMGDEFHVALLDEYLRRDLKSRVTFGAGTLAHRVVYNVNRVTTGLIDSSMTLLSSAIGMLVITASLLWINPGVVLAALGWIGAAYLLAWVVARRRLRRNGARERELVERRARMARESLRAGKELQTSARQDGLVERFDQVCHSLSRVWLANHLVAQSPRYVLECATFAGLVGMALFMNRGNAPASWLAQVSFIALAAYRLLPSVQQLFASAVHIRAGCPFLDEILPDLRAALLRRRAAPLAANDCFRQCPRHEIRLENVSVRFEGQKVPAIDDVSLVIPAGSMIGLVGPNGSGKTTLADVISGLLPADGGSVLVDELRVEDANRSAWCRHVAYVAQEVYLLEASIAANIAFCVPEREIDRELVADAARLAGLEPLLSQLPRGLDSHVAEEGRRLSVGFRQRVAIARAFYRRAQLLVLDEATSALDSLSERELVEVLGRMRGRCTMVLIAHRLPMLRNCDRIFELSAGRVIAQGTFDELRLGEPDTASPLTRPGAAQRQ